MTCGGTVTESPNVLGVSTVPKCSIIGEIFLNRLSKIMDWRKLIHPEPKNSAGKPEVKETQLSVEFLLGAVCWGMDGTTGVREISRTHFGKFARCFSCCGFKNSHINR